MAPGALTVIRGGMIADGGGGPLLAADLLIDGELIAGTGPPGAFGAASPAAQAPAGAEVIDASGLVVAPGFIDVHSHADNAPLLDESDTSKILQGVTTEVVGNCGFSLAPVDPAHEEAFSTFWHRRTPHLDWGWHSFAEFLAIADERGHVTNYAPLAGHGTLRFAVLGLEDRAPDGRELARMKDLLKEATEAGAFGMSSGLIYPPGMFSRAGELAELAKTLEEGRVYATHMRGEGTELPGSIAEAIAIAEGAGCRVQISHLKASGAQSWGRVPDALALLDGARARGVDVAHDVYPYDRSSTQLTVCLPRWFVAGGDERILAKLSGGRALARLRAEADIDYEGILVASTATHEFEGRTLAEIAADTGSDPFDAFTHVLVTQRLGVSVVLSTMSEPDVIEVMSHPRTMFGSDGLPPGRGGRPHPRTFGTFPRVLGHYVRDRGVLTLPDAIARMTSLPAATFSIPDRGRIGGGCVADLVAFDPARISGSADYRDPVRAPEGIAWVMQAGLVAVRDGRWLGRRLGRRLKPEG